MKSVNHVNPLLDCLFKHRRLYKLRNPMSFRTNSNGRNGRVRRNLLLNAVRYSRLYKISPRTSFEMTSYPGPEVGLLRFLSL